MAEPAKAIRTFNRVISRRPGPPETAAARMLEGDERLPHVPKPVTIRRFSWEKA